MDKSPKCDVKEKNTKQESSYSGFTTQNSIDKIIQSEQLGGDWLDGILIELSGVTEKF